MSSPKFPSGYRIGIVNPLTLVGNEVKTILRDRSFPFERIVLLDSTGKHGGALTEIADEPAVITAVSDDELEDLDLVFFCGAAEPNREWLQRAGDDKFLAIDLSQPSTLEDGKLAIAGVNLEELDADRLIVSPHPVAIPIALLLHQIERVAAVETCTATVVQPASEFEQEGVEELAQQTVSVLNIASIPKTIFDRQLAFNLYPALEHNEAFIVSQILAMTDSRVQLALLITQGTVFHSHTFSLFIRTRGEEVDVEAVARSLKENPAIVFAEGDQQFGTIDAAGKDEVLVAEVRADPSIPGGFWVWAVCDNLRRSSALNAVLIAEKLLFASDVAN